MSPSANHPESGDRERAGRTPFPARGASAAAVMAELFERKTADADWQRGRTFNLVYPTGRADVDRVLTEANNAYLFENALNPTRFPSLGTMQAEVLEMVSSLVNAPSRAGAGFTAGGTESILMSVLVSRERGRVERGITLNKNLKDLKGVGLLIHARKRMIGGLRKHEHQAIDETQRALHGGRELQAPFAQGPLKDTDLAIHLAHRGLKPRDCHAALDLPSHIP